jgi:hypothetical protein
MSMIYITFIGEGGGQWMMLIFALKQYARNSGHYFK